ncbi:lambda-like phage minor tail protein L [Faunimonas pinastri]|uniref:Lambda-like phage minor tail protein L n=1 Tax=Faunimonas pinastri TaxID=1855383 RepID=A0A1H9N274_9HYPH|nr:phage minor tail protein L [Faunimonas pinastri]SER29921.1 lambda-like phage minor tail protein L [Faunimonas pinastri]
MSDLLSVAQTPAPGERIALFSLDATDLGGQIYYFCQAAEDAKGVTFGGLYYTPVDVEFTDFETNAQGSLPTPHMKVANSNGVFQSIVNTYGDMLGCTVKRVRTFRRFLDGQEEADPTAYYGPDIFRVERKISENPVYIEWELSASIDQEGKELPGRQVIRDTCLWRYRSYNTKTQSFDYSHAQCPYAQSVYYDALDQVTTDKTKDACSRKISGCKRRFGEDAALPFGGFPGVARVRTS